jgi:hypothetical protein
MKRLTMQVRWLVMLLAFCLPAAAHAQIRITLNNKFIDDQMDRVLIDTKYVVEKAHERPNPPAKDGDLHVAGLSDDIRLPTVAELMNAKFETDAMDLIHDVEGTGKPIRVKGVWRLWCEHAGGEDQVQGAKIKTPFKNANPDHVFEIHPITQVEKVDCLKSLKPIKGFTPKKAEPAFHRYETTHCEIRPGKDTTTIITNGVGYNYVQFKMVMLDEVRKSEPQKQGGTPADDEGRFIMAEIQDLGGDILVRRLRVAFVKGSDPEKRAKNLKPGKSLTLLGIPRISLKLVQWRVHESATDADVLKWHLPYEIVAVGIYDDEDGARLRHRFDPFRLARAPSRWVGAPDDFIMSESNPAHR